MICPICFDAGKGEVDMEHVVTETTWNDPNAADGVGYSTTCYYQCNHCGRTDDCYSHTDDPEPE